MNYLGFEKKLIGNLFKTSCLLLGDENILVSSPQAKGLE